MRSCLLLTGLSCLLLAASACSDSEGTTIAGGGELLTEIPWQVPESETYRLLRDEEEIGTAELAVSSNTEGGQSPISAEGMNLFTQKFAFPERDITDEVSVYADGSTLKPATVARTVTSPDGQRNWEATYEGSTVTVVQSDADDERIDTIDVPQTSFDTWTDLFLWRTIEFRESYEVKYEAVVTAEFAKPDVISIVLKVTGLETVTVPAGAFDTWRVEIRSGGRTQKAWIADTPERTLVRYDNTELIFELES
jgi:hypothetical protein